MNKLKLSIFTISFLSLPVLADYVSPREYKDYTCDELQVDKTGWYEEMKKRDGEYLDLHMNNNSIAGSEAKRKSERAEAHLNAIKTVIKKKGCK